MYVLELIDIETTRIVGEEHQLCVYSISHMCSHIYVCVECIIGEEHEHIALGSAGSDHGIDYIYRGDYVYTEITYIAAGGDQGAGF